MDKLEQLETRIARDRTELAQSLDQLTTALSPAQIARTLTSRRAALGKQIKQTAHSPAARQNIAQAKPLLLGALAFGVGAFAGSFLLVPRKTRPAGKGAKP